MRCADGVGPKQQRSTVAQNRYNIFNCPPDIVKIGNYITFSPTNIVSLKVAAKRDKIENIRGI